MKSLGEPYPYAFGPMPRVFLSLLTIASTYSRRVNAEWSDGQASK